MRVVFSIILSVLVAGCVSADSGVLPLGPDTYQLSVGRAPIAGGPFEARRVALTQAEEYCANKNQKLMVISTKVWGENRGGFDIDFRCLHADDPDLRRPTLETVPDTVVEIRD